MNYEQKFQAVLTEVRTITTNMELILQEFREGVEHWGADGVKGCSKSTALVDALNLMHSSLCAMAKFTILASNYHIMSEHLKRLDPLTQLVVIAQMSMMEHEFARYQTRQKATGTRSDGVKGGSSDDWLERLMSDFKKGDN